MKMKAITTTLLSLSMFMTTSVFAADADKAKAEFEALKTEYKNSMEAATKSSDIRGGLVKACAIKYKKAVAEKILTQTEVTKLCGCSVNAEGTVTVADNWALQSAANAKNEEKIKQLQITMLKRQGDSIKKCVGTALDQKLTKLTQQAQAAATNKS